MVISTGVVSARRDIEIETVGEIGVFLWMHRIEFPFASPRVVPTLICFPIPRSLLSSKHLLPSGTEAKLRNDYQGDHTRRDETVA